MSTASGKRAKVSCLDGRPVAAIACYCLSVTCLFAADLELPVDEALEGRWASSESSEQGRLEALLTAVGDGRYELWFKVTDSPIFNAEGKPYPDEGVYALELTRTGDSELTFSYRQPFPRVKPLFFIPRSLTYRVRLEGAVVKSGDDRWQAMVKDHNLSIFLWVRPDSIAGTYDYDGRWASAAGSFKLEVKRRAMRKAAPRADPSTS
jgi:hypothetical protein